MAGSVDDIPITGWQAYFSVQFKCLNPKVATQFHRRIDSALKMTPTCVYFGVTIVY